MTLGHRVTFSGQFITCKAGFGHGEFNGAIFEALSLLGGPQSAVQIWGQRPCLTSGGQTAESPRISFGRLIRLVKTYLPCKFHLDLSSPGST